jgi:polysaccharide biosynthesis protein PslG
MASDFREAKYRAQSRYASGEPSWVRSRHVRAARLLIALIAAIGAVFASKPGEAQLIPGRVPDGRSAAELRAQDSGPVIFDDPDSKGVRGVAFTADGKFLATADANGGTYVWSLVTRRIAATLRDPGSHGVNAVAFRPGNAVLAAGDANGRVYLWQPGVKRPGEFTDPSSKGVRAVAFTPNGKFLAAADANGHVYVWSLATGKIVAVLHRPGSMGINAVAFKSGGRYLAAGDANGRADVWAPPKALEAALRDPGSKGIDAVAFRPRSGILATGDANGRIYLWQPGVARPDDLADPGSEGVRAVAFTPSGKFLAAADANGRAYVWSMFTDKVTDTFRDRGSRAMQAVAFSPDGLMVASGDASGHTYLFDLPPAVRPTIPSPAKPVGYVAHVLAQPDPRRYVQLIENGGATSLRDDVTWAWIEPARGRFDWSATDKIVTLAATHHLHLLLAVDTTPAWASGASMAQSDWSSLPPRKPSDYGIFAGIVAARYGAGGDFWRQHPNVPVYLPAGIEVWNEENLSGAWGGRIPNPAKYAAMIKAAYTRIKQADPKMTVLIGGLAPAGAYDDVTCSGHKGTGHDSSQWNGVNYLQALYADGIHGYFDAVAWHPYNFWTGATAAEMLAPNPCSAWTQMARTPVSARSLMVAHGDARKRIWITETGAPSCTTGARYICVSARQQAALATREVRLWRSLPWAGGFYWYDIRDDNRGFNNSESHFGAVLADNTPKPAYAALSRAWH